MDRINKNAEGFIYVDAPDSTGKFFIKNLLLAEIPAKQHIAVAIASPAALPQHLREEDNLPIPPHNYQWI